MKNWGRPEAYLGKHKAKDTLDIFLVFPTADSFPHLSEILLEEKKPNKMEKCLDKLERHSYPPESIQLWEEELGETKKG